MRCCILPFARTRIRGNEVRRNQPQLDMREKIRTIALIAHDGKKADMMAFAIQNKEILKNFHLVATATTGKLLEEKIGLKVDRCFSGPLGGDVQIASKVVSGEIHAVFFFDDLQRQAKNLKRRKT